MKTRKKEALALIASLLVLALLLAFLTRLLTPKQHDYGSTWGHYLAETPDSTDLLFFGSSLVYCDVAPAALWEASGLTSYVMAGPEQTIPTTYYYVKEALKTQSPQAIFVEITGVFYNRYTNYTKTNIGQMPWGVNRLQATFETAEPEVRSGLLFPLLFYHDRWSSLTADDLKITFRGYEPDPLAGYTYLSTYCQTDGVYERTIAPDAENQARSVAALKQIYELCMERGIRPVFFVAPALGRIPDEAMEPLKAQIRDWEGAYLLDCNEQFDQIGADETRDFHDTLHYNVSGAYKFAGFLSGWIKTELALTPAKGQDTALWQQRSDHLRQLSQQPLVPAQTE